MPAVLTGVLVVPLTPAVLAVPVVPACADVPACVLPLMLPAVLGVWLEVLLEGYWLELALLDVCGGAVLVELDGYCELDEFEVAVPLIPALVPAFELEVLGVELLVALLWVSEGLVLEELGYALLLEELGVEVEL